MNLYKLTSNRIIYTPFQEDDFNGLLAILSDEKVCEYLPGDSTYTEAQVHKWLDFFIRTFNVDKKNVIYAMRIAANDEIIGYCGCNYVPEFETNEIKYILNSNYFGNGYASEAAYKMKEVAVELGLSELVGLADVNNIPSQKILEKIGYEYKKTIELWGATLKYYELKL